MAKSLKPKEASNRLVVVGLHGGIASVVQELAAGRHGIRVDVPKGNSRVSANSTVSEKSRVSENWRVSGNIERTHGHKARSDEEGEACSNECARRVFMFNVRCTVRSNHWFFFFGYSENGLFTINCN